MPTLDLTDDEACALVRLPPTRSPPTRSCSRPGDPLKASPAKLEVAEAAVEAVATGLKALA